MEIQQDIQGNGFLGYIYATLCRIMYITLLVKRLAKSHIFSFPTFNTCAKNFHYSKPKKTGNAIG